MSTENFQSPWRRNFEVYMAVGWMLAAIVILYMTSTQASVKAFGITIGLMCLLMAAFRGWQAIVRLEDTARLSNQDLEFMSLEELYEKTKEVSKKNGLWLGNGFSWTDVQATKLHNLITQGIVKTLGKVAQSDNGAYWIHGLDKACDVVKSLASLVGHTLLVGATRVGKTRLYDVIVNQAIFRNECVIVIDPKGDKELVNNMRRSCELMGMPERFVYFHPAHPQISTKIDPLRNWNRRTELASRIATLIPSETGADPFTAFSWKVLNDLINGLINTFKRPNLVNLRQYVEGGPEALLVKSLRNHFDANVEDWEKRASTYLKKFNNEIARAYIAFYKDVVVHQSQNPDIEGLISTFEHNRDHFQKMVASLIPILSMLTSDSLKGLLSPDHQVADADSITDMAKVIQNNKVVYIGLDSLADPTVGSAIGSILLADLTAIAGDRYNYGINNLAPVNLFIDEAAETLNEPAIALMNKGGGSMFRVTIATQTFADFVARLGDESKARQVLANTNNKIALRVLDAETQKYFAEGMTPFKGETLETMYGSGVDPAVHSEYGGQYREAMKREEAELFPAALLGELPPMHYIARWAGGAATKGKFPIIGTPNFK